MSKLHDAIHERFPLILIILFALSSTVAFAISSETKERVDVIIDIFAILVGVVSVFLVMNVVKSFKGSLKKSFNYIIFGISFQILALVEHALSDLGISVKPWDVDVHHLIMITGIVFFTIAVFKLRGMLSELNKKS